jgi:hypothetical protein
MQHDAVATASAFFACGSAEVTVFFRCFGGKAAKTTEIHGFFHAAAGEKRPLWREQPRRPRTSWKRLLFLWLWPLAATTRGNAMFHLLPKVSQTNKTVCNKAER